MLSLMCCPNSRGSFTCLTTASNCLVVKRAKGASFSLSPPWDAETSSAKSTEKYFVLFLHNTRLWLRFAGAAIDDGHSNSSSGVKLLWNLDAKVFVCIRTDTRAGQAGQNE